MLVCAPLAAEDALPPGTLSGRVLDARTGEPIAKALVSIRNRELEAVTDGSGRFTLTDDPLRSVQSLPGVASTDDFGTTFAARGSGGGVLHRWGPDECAQKGLRLEFHRDSIQISSTEA